MRLPTERSRLTLNSWSYRGEGNANLVVALPYEHVIVRLRKSSQDTSSDAESILRGVQFWRDVMRPLLGRYFVHVPEVIHFTPRELEWLTDRIKPLRPKHRHHKSKFVEVAVKLPDLCLLQPSSPLPTFCIEIKPKQGWVPVEDRKLPKCPFCLIQFLKLKNGTVSGRSGYCPMDLFSGDEYRMKTAISALIASPQNNFKIFRDGSLQYGESSTSCLPVLQEWFGAEWSGEELMNNLYSLLIRTLTADFGTEDLPDAVCCELSTVHLRRKRENEAYTKAMKVIDEPSCYKGSESNLPVGSILGRILRVQQLDLAGSDEVQRLYSEGCYSDAKFLSDLIVDLNAVLDPVYAHLLATTAKDCSVLLAFRRIEEGEEKKDVVEDLNGNRYKFSIGVCDLDIKEMSGIEKRRRKTLEAARYCIKYFQHRSVGQSAV